MSRTSPSWSTAVPSAAKTLADGNTTERVDTRVLQAIYKFAPSEFPAFVGQRVHVFIAAPSWKSATRSPTSGQIASGAPVADGARTVSAASRASIEDIPKQYFPRTAATVRTDADHGMPT